MNGLYYKEKGIVPTDALKLPVVTAENKVKIKDDEVTIVYGGEGTPSWANARGIVREDSLGNEFVPVLNVIYQEIKGDLIKLALDGKFDVVAHGCNCHSTMGAGIAPQMAKAFGCDKFPMELDTTSGFNKLGNIDYKQCESVIAVNCYTQFNFDRNKPLDYDALKMCLKKLNYTFKGKHIGLPLIGCGLAGGDWNIVKKMIQEELKDCIVTVVHYSN